MTAFAFWGYGFAACAYAIFGLYLYLAWRGGRIGGALLAAVGLSLLWALAQLWSNQKFGVDIHVVVLVLDVLRAGGWFVFLLLLLGSTISHGVRRYAVVAVAVLAVQLAGVASSSGYLFTGTLTLRLYLGGALAGAILGLALVEQIYRSLAADARWALKPVLMGLGASFLFELYLFADGFLFGRLDPLIWVVRGPAHALVLPLIALSVMRNPAWALRMAPSRAVVFHTAALGAAGAYLLVVAAAGYYVRYFGGEWGQALQMVLLFAALVLMAAFMSSAAQRARLKIYLSKHLFPYRYDYRAEWLRFTQALATPDSRLDLGQMVIKSLGNLVESTGGVLWLRVAGEEEYRPCAHINQVEVDAAKLVEAADSSLVRFLREREWIINLEECRANQEDFRDLALPAWLMYFPDAWLLIPLTGGSGLVGFVLLGAPRTRFEIDWEVLDLLKTAQHQAASYLERMLATTELLEARKFESFTRMSAFVVHDLKNLVAQLSLMLKNAERHKDNPEFQQDMLETVAHVESKMRELMAQLQEKRSIDPPRAVDLVRVLENIRQRKRGQRPAVELQRPAQGGVVVQAHPERLERVIGHIVQNAIEASHEDSKVTVTLDRSAVGRVRVVVEDHGRGMSETFLREHLARPFETTKASGMGIGVYETRQYIRELGGEVNFESTLEVGTRVSIELPGAAPATRDPGRTHIKTGEGSDA
ncbi:histidine kinase [Betaproteobacteria bacterium]|nr:histidine kinase [Betaproteobacteria bacterium]